MVNLDTLSHVEILQIIDMLGRLHDDANVSRDMAALYLGMSKRTLDELRSNGSGPPFAKRPSAEGSKARNQGVTYRMGDLRKWRDEHTVTSTMDEAVRRGLAFGSLHDLTIEQPFVVRDWKGSVAIIGHCARMGRDALRDALENPSCDIGWFPWDEALSMPWIGESGAVFREAYMALLRDAISAVQAAGERDALSETMPDDSSPPPPPLGGDI